MRNINRVVLVIVFLLAGILLLMRVTQEGAQLPAAFPADAPAPRAQDYVVAQKGFQYLVSYTGGRFVPQALSVMKGETVRFTNNSDSTLRLTLFGATIASLAHAEYFEYAFTETGTFSYGDGSNTGTVTVIK